MKREYAVAETQPGAVRAGVISLLILVSSYLYLSGISSLPRAWEFIVLFAVCLLLMIESLADLLVWAFGTTARGLGFGLGHVVSLVRRIV